MKKILSLLTLCTLASLTKADNILTFNFEGMAGNIVTTNSNFNDPNLTPSAISRGAGVSPAAGAGRFNSSGWSTNDLANAIMNNDFVAFGVTNSGGSTFSITNITLVSQRSNSGATNVAIRGSHDNFATDLGTYILPVGAVPQTNSFDVSGVALLQNRNTPVEFRIFGFSAGATGGTLGVGGTPGNNDDVIIEGSVIPGMGGGGSSNTVTIASTANASELGTNGIFTLTNTGTNTPITVTYTIGGTATLTNDYDFSPVSTATSIVMTTTTTNLIIVPVNDGPSNDLNPESVIVTLDPSGLGWTSAAPNSATVDIFEGDILNPPTNGVTNLPSLTGFQLVLKAGFKPGKTVKWKSAKGIAPLKGPKGQIISASNTVTSVAYALIVGASGTNGTNAATNALNFITAGNIKQITKGPLAKKNVKAKFKATKTSKLGIGVPAGTTSAKLVVRVTGTSGTNTGSQFFTNTYTTVVK